MVIHLRKIYNGTEDPYTSNIHIQLLDTHMGGHLYCNTILLPVRKQDIALSYPMVQSIIGSCGCVYLEYRITNKTHVEWRIGKHIIQTNNYDSLHKVDSSLVGMDKSDESLSRRGNYHIIVCNILHIFMVEWYGYGIGI